jgi:hypothetical protein
VAALAGITVRYWAPRPEHFPFDLRGATVGEAPPVTPEKLTRRLGSSPQDRSRRNPACCRNGFVTRVPAPAGHGGSASDGGRTGEIWAELGAPARLHRTVSLEPNVDNAWFFHDDAGGCAAA